MKTSPDEHASLEAPIWWRSLDEKAETPSARKAAHDEFLAGVTDAPPPGGFSRRDFMGLVGAATTLATATACSRRERGPVIAYTRRPSEVVPGVANFYASAFPEGRRAQSVLVKTREGRPILVQGNDEHPGQRGKASARAQADILRLYDAERLRAPRLEGREASWKDTEARLLAGIQQAKASGKAVLLISGATTSPTRQALLKDLKAALPTLQHLAWEPSEGQAQAGHLAAFGQNLIAVPRLAKAKVIVSLGADPLSGDDPGAIADFAAHRRLETPKGEMNRLWAFEGGLTLTGSKADHRFPVKPSRLAQVGFALARALSEHGVALPAGVSASALPGGLPEGVEAKAWKLLVEDLRHAGKAVAVLCGDGAPAEAHAAAALLNVMLGAEGVDYRPAETLAGPKEMEAAIAAMTTGQVGAVILWGANPGYAWPKAHAFRDGLAKVPSRTWIGVSEDETSPLCQTLLPEHHWLEAWGDHLDLDGHLLLQQPAIGALYDTRQGEDILLGLLRGLGVNAAADYHGYLKARWQKEEATSLLVPFERFFETTLHDGLLKDRVPAIRPSLKGEAVVAAARTGVATSSGFELILRPDSCVHDGRYSNNGWLQELPDPITKATWTNPLSVSVADARALGLQDGDLVLLQVGGTNTALPILVQPGQAKGVVSLALGYGRGVGAQGKGQGFNAYPLMDVASATPTLRLDVRLAKGRGHKDIPLTQSHHRLEGRDLLKSWTLAEFAHHAAHPHPAHELHSLHIKEIEYKGQKWGMAIDLAACVGCSGCVMGCQTENNVPVVGPEQVHKGREMHWLRIDRYYEGSEDNPKVVHQPMLCQHCDEAPCENVCPVNATNHSPDGLNQMAYNRCVGTRYCANNCPYKVRRFNFLEFTADKQEPESLVFNPEVTVRPRGVMEKCTFCVQRINDGRQRAIAEGRPLADGDIVPACAQACPSDAIIFGDLNDPNSRVAKLAKSQRGFKVLEELGVRPAITYLADLKNPAGEGGHHEA